MLLFGLSSGSNHLVRSFFPHEMTWIAFSIICLRIESERLNSPSPSSPSTQFSKLGWFVLEVPKQIGIAYNDLEYVFLLSIFSRRVYFRISQNLNSILFESCRWYHSVFTENRRANEKIVILGIYRKTKRFSEMFFKLIRLMECRISN